LEDAEDYKAFEAAVIADFDPETAVARELVLRLASLLWRLRRANAIEANLFEIQAEALEEQGVARAASEREPSQTALRSRPINGSAQIDDLTESALSLEGTTIDYKVTTRQLTYCFLRLLHLDAGVFERLSRYEVALWRQTVQILMALHPIRHR
jgi:hypothetical protein